MTRTQEALDNIVEYFNNRGIDRDCIDDIQDSIDELQKLIDNYSKLVRENEEKKSRIVQKLLPCTCGHNRRHKYYNLEGKIAWYECDNCGKNVIVDGSNYHGSCLYSYLGRQLAIKWNQVMKKDDELDELQKLIDESDKEIFTAIPEVDSSTK